jgi:hypothetical protein
MSAESEPGRQSQVRGPTGQPLGTTSVREMVGGTGVLLVLVDGAAILATWSLPNDYSYGPIEIGGPMTGVAGILAAGHLPDEASPRHGQRVARPATIGHPLPCLNRTAAMTFTRLR